MPDQRRSRRDVLRRGSLAAVSLAGIAGCTGGGGGASTTPKDGSETTETVAGDPGGSTSEYHDWLPSPSDLTGESHYEYLYVDVNSLRNNDSVLYPDRPNGLQGFFDNLATRTGASPESTAGYLSIGSEGIQSGLVKTLLGSYDPTTVGSGLRDGGYQESSSVGDYSLFTGGKEFSGVGVGRDGIAVPGDEGSVENLETVLETVAGDGERYVAADPSFERLVEELGSGFLVSGGTNPRFETEAVRVRNPQFVGQVAAGATLQIEGERTAVTYVFVFEDAAAVDVGPVEEWLRLERTSGLVAPFDPETVEREDRVVRASGSTKTELLFGG